MLGKAKNLTKKYFRSLCLSTRL